DCPCLDDKPAASGIRGMERLAGSTHQAGHRRAMPSDPGARRATLPWGRRRPEPLGAPREPKSVQPERPDRCPVGPKAGIVDFSTICSKPLPVEAKKRAEQNRGPRLFGLN